MTAEDVAAVAGLLADRTRAAVCVALLDGRAWTAGELARRADVAPSTMSEHLSRLVGGGLVEEARQGRHRYVRLAGAPAAVLVEQLLQLSADRAGAPRGGRPAGTLSASSAAAALRRARTCYDHLAGRLGLAVTAAMAQRGLVDEDLALTAEGHRWLAELTGGTPVGVRRPWARPCLDATERRPHLAGAAAAALCSELFTRGWLRRIGTGRAVLTTADGDRALAGLLGLDTAWRDGPIGRA